MTRPLPRLLRRRWPWVLLALIVRLAFALKLGGRQYQTDEAGFRAMAWQLATFGLLGDEGHPSASAPIPVCFFALCFKIGPSLLWPRLAQAFVGAASAFALGEMTAELSSSALAGRLALAISCVYPFFIYYNGMVLSETLDLALLIPGLWWLCAALRRPCPGWQAAAGGLTLALAGLCRAEGAFIAGAIWTAAALLCAARRWSWRAWALGAICWLIPLLGWCARNKALLGAFTLDTHGGMTMLHGTELFELNNIDTGVAQAAFEKTDLFKSSQALPEAERDKAYLRESKRYMLAHPGLTARQWVHKFLKFWRFYPRFDKRYAENQFSHPAAGLPRWALALISLSFDPWLILGGFYGLWLLRRRVLEIFPLYLWVIGTTAIHVVSVSQMRYRLTVMPVLIFGACVALARLVGDAIAQDR